MPKSFQNTNFQNPELHPRKFFTRKNNLDRYGFSNILKKYTGTRFNYRPFCQWIHGAIWWDDYLDIDDIVGPVQYRNDLSIVVATEAQKKTCRDHGYKNVYIGGLPINYTEEFSVKRNEDVLVAYISHSSEGQEEDVLDINYLDFLSSLRNKYETIYVSVFGLDISKSIVNEISRRGLKVYEGAHPEETYSMERTKAMMMYAGKISANTMDSSVAYALNFGCKVSIFEDLHPFNPSNLLKSGWDKRHIQRYEHIYSYKYLKERFPKLFKPLDECECDVGLGQLLCGSNYKMLPATVKDVIGWTPKAQFINFSKSAFHKLTSIR